MSAGRVDFTRGYRVRQRTPQIGASCQSCNRTCSVSNVIEGRRGFNPRSTRDDKLWFTMHRPQAELSSPGDQSCRTLNAVGDGGVSLSNTGEGLAPRSGNAAESTEAIGTDSIREGSSNACTSAASALKIVQQNTAMKHCETRLAMEFMLVVPAFFINTNPLCQHPDNEAFAARDWIIPVTPITTPLHSTARR